MKPSILPEILPSMVPVTVTSFGIKKLSTMVFFSKNFIEVM
jgi:hypothetical protein